jgi:YrbI family 3-deoxy-D-manno-octulosonate 8-phosphate phosphatase
MISSEKINLIKAVVLDIDGVLTDGRLGYSSGDEIKFFHIRDGHGIKLALRAGLKVGFLSGRAAAANRKRAEELGVSFIYESKKNKSTAFRQLLTEHQLSAEECMYIGDDVIDIPPMRMAGIAVTVGDAPDYMDKYCHFRTALHGGYGAVREAIEWLLMRQGKWDQLMERYLNDEDIKQL